MEELFKTFHVDIKILIAQIINFVIVLVVLFKFAYRPLLKIMNERTGKIEKGLEDAKKAQEQLENAEKDREKRLIQAKKEAKTILEEAQKMAEKNKEETINNAKEESQKVVEQAKSQIAQEKEKMLREVKGEIGNLVVLATEKLISLKIDKTKDGEMINKTIESI
jgi:F-type H+-transporting ATPase subunit b